MTETKFWCGDCGTLINEGEAKTFGICDDCWTKHHQKMKDNGAMSFTEGSEPIKLTADQELIKPVYRDEKLIIFKCEDFFYPEYAGKFFVLEKSIGYGYFHNIRKLYTRGNILDEFNIILESLKSDSK